MARLIGSPWPLFTHDHFVTPGSVFRPLGFASLWLCTMLFGTDYAANATADLVLHAGVGLALFGLLRRAEIPRPIALLCSLLFALHPVAIGTALWWSARFDLLATLFVLVSLNAALACRQGSGATALPLALVAALAAMASKETGLVLVVPLSLVWLRWSWIEPARRARALVAVVLAWSCAVVWFVWRWRVLGTPSSDLTGAVPVRAAIENGLVAWASQVFGYLSFWPRMDGMQRAALVIAVLAGLSVICVRLRGHMRRGLHRYGEIALVGLSLFVLPALLQAPVAALNAAPLSAGTSAIEAAMQSRLHYLGVVGLAIMCAALFSAAWPPTSGKWRIALLAPAALALLAFAGVSRHGARMFAVRSVEISAVARAAVDAVARLDLPSSRCHVVFLAIEPAPEWSIYVSMDAIVKALSPDLDRVAACYFEANYVTWFHLQRAPASPADAAPYSALEIDGIALPWRRVGDLVIAYLHAPETVDRDDLARMIFLRYRDGRFENVSADVVAGRLPVRLDVAGAPG
jgi:hypothetical protein